MTKVDLHIHSRHSAHAPEYLFRRVGFPHATPDPEEVYAQLKETGMDFVTLTDHDTIDGCLEIAGHGDVFLSEEVTTYFPEDHIQIHVLAWGITSEQHEAIQRIRPDIYDLANYLTEQGIAHGVAHPLKSYNAHVAARHVARLLQLFPLFETTNGLVDSLFSEASQAIVRDISGDRLAELAERYPLPKGISPRPGLRRGFGGSNDHAGLAAGEAWTETPPAADTGALLEHLRSGRTEARGTPGSPVRISHGLYKAAFSFLQDHLFHQGGAAAALFGRILERFIEGENPTHFTWAEKLRMLGDIVRSGQLADLARQSTNAFYRDLARFLSHRDFQQRLEAALSSEETPDRRAFRVANLIADEIAFRIFRQVADQLRRGQFLQCVEQISAAAPLAMLLAPYYYAFQSQTGSYRHLSKLVAEVLDRPSAPLRTDRRAWFTDTLYDVNGVSMTIRKLTEAAVSAGREVTIVACSREAGIEGLPIRNFPPIGEFDLPEYEVQKVNFPPILPIVDFVRSGKFTELIISTPGAVGLAGMLAGRLLGIPVATIYHTDFPQYVNILTDDSFLETVAWRFMRWFYDLSDLIYVNSEHYRKIWIDRGIAAGKIATLPRGMDTDHFHPSKRRSDFWQEWKADGADPVVLFVGRVSKEKDLDVLAAAHRELSGRGIGHRMAIIGDGPYLPALRASLPEAIFPGYLAGERLAAAYASADVFAFPSTTDTYGNVVVEAMACGVPCVVSDVGGPKDLVRNGETGLVTPGRDAKAFAAALETLIRDEEGRSRMGEAARASVAERSWAAAAKRFWERSAGSSG